MKTQQGEQVKELKIALKGNHEKVEEKCASPTYK